MFDLIAHIYRARAFSRGTFGPTYRPTAICNHIRKELAEIEKMPLDLEEWIDVVILGLDGAWRSGHSPEEIVAALRAKQEKNENREWPDWRTVAADVPIEHIRKVDPAKSPRDKLRAAMATAGFTRAEIDRCMEDDRKAYKRWDPPEHLRTPVNGSVPPKGYELVEHDERIGHNDWTGPHVSFSTIAGEGTLSVQAAPARPAMPCCSGGCAHYQEWGRETAVFPAYTECVHPDAYQSTTQSHRTIKNMRDNHICDITNDWKLWKSP